MWNHLVAELWRLSQLTADAPLRLAKDGGGYHIGIDPTQVLDPGGTLPVDGYDCFQIVTDVQCINGYLVPTIQYLYIPTNVGAFISDTPCSGGSTSGGSI